MHQLVNKDVDSVKMHGTTVKKENYVLKSINSASEGVYYCTYLYSGWLNCSIYRDCIVIHYIQVRIQNSYLFVYVDEVIVAMSMDFDVTDLRLARYFASTSFSVKI